MADLTTVARAAREAALSLAYTDEATRNSGLKHMQEALVKQKDEILAANKEDLDAAAEQVSAGKMSSAMFKRLSLEGKKFDQCVMDGVSGVMSLPDPLGQVSMGTTLDTGLELYRASCPIGVLCIIFESRPDAAVSIPALAVKSGNAVILKGGKEAAKTCWALVAATRAGLKECGLNPNAVQYVETRAEVQQLLSMNEYIDLVIPRGSKSLVEHVQTVSSIPVLGHADGLCSAFVDQEFDVQTACDVIVDSKTQYPAVCNALETLLVHKDSVEFLKELGPKLAEKGVEVHACPASLPHLPADITKPAQDSDYDTEFLELILAVKVVDSLQDAISHINQHGSGHTDAIVTTNKANADEFMLRVDSASVMHNASTRFADGFRYGFGAEIGVSTNKTHARGPVGLEGLTIYKYRVYGHGDTVAPFSNGEKQYAHTKIESPSLP